LLLILAAGIAGLGLRGQDRPDPAPPAAATLTAGSAFQVVDAYAPGQAGMPFQQWLLRTPGGAEALLYVGSTSHVQAVVRWSGELGYLGEGYLVTGRHERTIRLGDGSAVTVSGLSVQRLDDRRLLLW